MKIIKTAIILAISIFISSCTPFLLKVKQYSLDLSEEKVIIDNLTLFYLDNNIVSKKSPILLVHGFTSNSNSWLNFYENLNIEDRRIIIIDLPGHGKSSFNYEKDYSIFKLSDILGKFIDNLNIKNPHIVGHSMGGAISAIYASKKQDVASLTLIDSAGFENDNLRDNVEKIILSVKDRDSFTKYIKFTINTEFDINFLLKGHFLNNHLQKSEIYQKIYNDNKNQKENSFIGKIKNIKIPSFIVWGKEDKMLPYGDIYKFLEYIKNSKIKILENAGHTPIIEYPEKVAEVFLYFLKENDKF